MYEHILVAIDFSDPATEALRWAISRFPEAEITLCHVTEAREPPPYLQRALQDEVALAGERELDVRTNLELLAAENGIVSRISVRSGWLPAQLHGAARECGAQLILLGVHRKRLAPWDQPGMTAEAVMRKAEVPVLAWRPVQHERNKTVLAAVDLREGSAPVTATAARYAAYFHTRLLLLHVLPVAYQAYLRAVSTPTKVEESLHAIEQSAREEALGRIPPELRSEVEAQVIIARGHPVTQILASAESEACDLIVIGERHAPAFGGRTLLGGVTGRVVPSANCSVLTVPV